MPSHPAPAGQVIVARLVRPRGLQGEILAEAEDWTPDQLLAFPTLTLHPSGQRVELASARPQQDRLILKFRGFDDANAAETLRDQALCIPREDRPALPAGKYYFSDLIGCHVIDARAPQAPPIGVVTDCLEYGGPVLLDVRAGRREILIPLVPAICRIVDIEQKRITVDLPEGLDEL